MPPYVDNMLTIITANSTGKFLSKTVAKNFGQKVDKTVAKNSGQKVDKKLSKIWPEMYGLDYASLAAGIEVTFSLPKPSNGSNILPPIPVRSPYGAVWMSKGIGKPQFCGHMMGSHAAHYMACHFG